MHSISSYDTTLGYVLPNYTSQESGRLHQAGEFLDPHEQVVLMNNERFLIPEILFRPDDIGAADATIAPRHD
jgi:actin-related protein 6